MHVVISDYDLTTCRFMGEVRVCLEFAFGLSFRFEVDCSLWG